MRGVEDVVRRAQAGDTTAFGELVESTTPKVRAVIGSRVSNRDDIADLTQEVYLKALRSIGALDDPTRVEAWLATIARNCANDFHRSRARRPTTELTELEQDLIESDMNADEMAELRLLASSVRVGVGRLAPLDAALIAMVTLLGFTPTDISASLGLSPTAAKVALHRARKRLRQAMLLDDAAGKPPTPCQDFRDLAAFGLLVPAALHARECRQCSRRSGRASTGPDPGDPAPLSGARP